MTAAEKIEIVPSLKNWELIRDFEIESLNLDYIGKERNRINSSIKSTDSDVKAASARLKDQQEVFNAYRDEIIKRMTK